MKPHSLCGCGWLLALRATVLAFPLLALPVRAEQLVASPEGTVTTYVSREGPLVFAPRAARAQKVIFDTPEKQLVYAPDTPFRRFFDSRANDFDSSGLEYAKTTILGDIVARLRSREYVREVVGKVVDDYREYAISGASFAEQWHYRIMVASNAVAQAKKNTTNIQDQIQLELFTLIALPQEPEGYEELSEQLIRLNGAIQSLIELVKVHPNPSQASAALKILESIRSELAVGKFGGGPTGGLEELERLDALQKRMSSLLNVLAGVGASIPATSPSNQSREQWRGQRAELLRDTLYLRLLQQDYPDMEDDEIDRFVEEFASDANDVWALATRGETNDVLATKAMTIELRQRLKQRDWLNDVVQAAIGKRTDLFKKAGSPVQGLRDVEGAFEKLVNNNLASTILSNAARSDAISLWRGFLLHANAQQTNTAGRAWLQPAGNPSRPMDAGELRTFGNDLRGKLLQADPRTGQRRNMEQMKEYLADLLSKPPFSENLCPDFDRNNLTPAELRSWWPPALTNHEAVRLSFEEYTNALWASDLTVTTNAVRAFVERLGVTLTNLNAARAPDDRVDVSELRTAVTNQATKLLLPLIVAKGTAKPLRDIVSQSFANLVIPLNTDRARRKLITDFEATFNGWLDLLASDDPIVTAFLKSSSVRFATAEMRRKAVASIPKLYFVELKKERGNVEVFKDVVENPEIAFLFGDGPANPQVVEAFTREFYSAFHDPKKLREALDAEREADYDYWWLTFYPKAIPVGANKLAGESIIEVAFPDAVVPDVQYHRWLQDSKLDGWSRPTRSEGNHRGKLAERAAPRLEDVPGGLLSNLKLRNASALLRDTLTVLETSELKARFTEVRPMMLHALEAFTEPRQTEEERYWNGIRTLYHEVFPEDREWLSEMARLADEGGITEEALRISRPSVGMNGAKPYRLGDFDLDVDVLKPQTNSVNRILKRLRYQVGAEGKGKTAELAKKLVTRLSAEPLNGVEQRQFARDQFASRLEEIGTVISNAVNSQYFELAARGEGAPIERNALLSKLTNSFEVEFQILYTQEFNTAIISSIVANLEYDWKSALSSPGEAGTRRWRQVSITLENALRDELNVAVRETESQLKEISAKGGGAEEVRESYRDNVKELLRSFAISFYLKQKPNVQVMSEIRQHLKRIEFEPMHVLFSVMAVTETKARLPEKVNLFVWAGAQGVMLFSTPIEKIMDDPDLHEHARNYFSKAKPLRGDDLLGCICEIPKECLKAMQAEADLYSLILNAYFSAYPDVPSRESIRASYFDDGKERLRSLFYDWLDYYGVLYESPFSPSLARLLGKQSFLSEKSQKMLFQIVTKQLAGEKLTGARYRNALARVVDDTFTNANYYPLVAELDEHLFDAHYASLWNIAEMVEETERHVVPYSAIQKEDYRTFRSWARPAYQRGIQIVEMLPGSRDDLVSMSINEGGVVARLAAQGDASAAYDMNNLKMAQRYASMTGKSLDKLLKEREQQKTNGLGTLTEKFSEASSTRNREVYRDLAEIGKSATSQGYSLGATAQGSAYGRAKSALAYARRREYLDAAITAAGRGDNFAKWVVRKSDLRSDLAKQGGKKLVAAAHNGFPNGDQPFHLLVKIPRGAVKEDWNGRKYVFFNSTYIATKKVSAWRTAGFPGLALKAPLVAINPHWWSDIEEGIVGTQFPFMWDVKERVQQPLLLREPNFLGGEVWLDDTDKVKHSEILEMLAAEDTFVRVTREAQSQDLGRVMTEIEKESTQFGKEVRDKMSDRMQKMDEAFGANSPTNRIQRLEEEVKALKERLAPTNAPASTTTTTNGAASEAQ